MSPTECVHNVEYNVINLKIGEVCSSERYKICFYKYLRN